MKIHVVSFQVPYPADYGGVIDVFYKLKALNEIGFEVILHTFQYDRERQPVLDGICSKVLYYPRQTGWRRQFSRLPYIVNSRQDSQLLDDLCIDDAPILFEGLHSCYYLNHPRLHNRRRFVRMHNIEHEYYQRLAKQTPRGWRRLYYTIESLKLKRFEQQLRHADIVAAITKADMQKLEKCNLGTKIIHLPCFFDADFNPEAEKVETESFVLYQGNLAVEENIVSANFIIKELAPRLPEISFVIAGKNPSFSHLPNNVKLIANPSDETMTQLISTARIHLLLTNMPTGIKLKLINALVKGNGHIIANRQMLYGHALGKYCIRADKTEDMAMHIRQCMQSAPSPEQILIRHYGIAKMKKAGISRLSLFK